jgi:hypothetical protein
LSQCPQKWTVEVTCDMRWTNGRNSTIYWGGETDNLSIGCSRVQAGWVSHRERHGLRKWRATRICQGWSKGQHGVGIKSIIFNQFWEGILCWSDE